MKKIIAFIIAIVTISTFAAIGITNKDKYVLDATTYVEDGCIVYSTSQGDYLWEIGHGDKVPPYRCQLILDTMGTTDPTDDHIIRWVYPD